MIRDEFTNDGGYSEIYDSQPLLEAAEAYMRKHHKATGDGRWGGPGPGVYYSMFKDGEGREFKVKAFYVADEEGAAVGQRSPITKPPQQRLEIVEVLERVILNRRRL